MNLSRFLSPIKKRIFNMIARGVIKSIKEGGNLRAQMSLLAEETLDNLEILQDYGFTSKPLSGAEGVVIFPAGDKSHGLVIATGDRRYRLEIENGEVALFDDLGSKVHLKRGGTVEVSCSTKVLLTTPLVEATANMKVNGNLEVVGTSDLQAAVTAGATIEATGNISSSAVVAGATLSSTTAGMSDVAGKVQDIIDTYNVHTHEENGTGGGTTDEPNEIIS